MKLRMNGAGIALRVAARGIILRGLATLDLRGAPKITERGAELARIPVRAGAQIPLLSIRRPS